MRDITTARPTEYKGVRFRSKSEAIFARALDSFQGLLWEYEPPEWIQDDGWGPDFKTVFKCSHALIVWAIEYKPGQPTETYLEESWRRFRKIEVSGKTYAMLVSGSAFDGEGLIWREAYRSGWRIRNDLKFASLFYSAMQTAIKFRFDLQSA